MVLGQWREETSQVGHGKDIKTRRITMKKLYTTILIIAVTLFISCDENKAEDEIKKALDKTVDKTTPKPTVTKPVLSATSVRVGQVATFPKVKGYSYRLKQAVTGVELSDVEGEPTKKQVSSTEAVIGVVIVATFEGKSTESDPIEFVHVTLTKPVVSSYRVRTGQVATFPKVLGHTYTLKNATSGVTLSDVKGDATKKQISSTQAVTDVRIVATLDGLTEESDPIEFVLIELTKPVVSATRVKVGTPITFPKIEAHTYALKEAVTGVTLSDVTGDTTKKQVSSTEAATGVVIVATLDGITSESEPINFIEVIKPVLSSERAPWDTVITFPKEPGYTYALKEAKTGVALTEATSGDTMQVTATQYAQNVIIVATVDGLTEESDSIEFTRIQGNTLSFAHATRTARRQGGRTFTQTAIKSETVTEDDRAIRYTMRRNTHGAKINPSTGKITIKFYADVGPRTVTAKLQQTAKYEESTATYTITINY